MSNGPEGNGNGNGEPEVEPPYVPPTPDFTPPEGNGNGNGDDGNELSAEDKLQFQRESEAREKAKYEAQQQAIRDAKAAKAEAARASAEAERIRLEALRTGGGGNGGNGGGGGGGGNGNGGNGGNGNGNGNGNGGGGGTERTKPTVTERTAPGPNATQEEIDAWNNYLTAEGERQRKAVADKAAADAAAKRGEGENTHNTTSSVTDNTEPDDPIPADDDPDGKKRKKEDVAPSGKYDKDGNLIVDPNYKPKYYTHDGKRPTNTYSYDRRAPIMPTSSTRGGGRSEDVVEDPTDPSYRAGLHSESSRTTGEGTFHGADPFADLGSPEAGSRYAGLVNRLNEPPLDRSAYGKAKAASEAREPAFRRAKGEPERPGNWDSMSFDQKQAWFNQNEPTPEEELARKKAERTDINSGVDIYGNPLEAPDPNRMPVRGGGGEGERSVGEHSLYNDELLINSGPRRPVAGEGGPGPGTGPQEGERSVYRPPPPDFADAGFTATYDDGPREKLRLPGHQEGGETSQETSGLPREIFDIAMAALNQQVPQSEKVVAMLMDQYPEEMIELITRITDSSRGQQMASQVQQMNLGGIVTRGYIPEFADGGMESSGAVDDRVAVSKDDLVEEDFQDRLENGGPLDVVAALAPNEYIITAEQTTESDPQDMIQAAEAIPADTPPGAAVWDSFTNNLDRVI